MSFPAADRPDALWTLLAIEEIKALKARYFRCLDLRLWDELAGVFSEDVRFNRVDLDGNEEWLQGREAVMAYTVPALTPVRSVHHGHTPEIHVYPPDRATGVWAMEDRVWCPDGKPFVSMHGFGHYHETYSLTEAGWQISVRRLTRIHLEIVHAPEQ
ncbi:conserved hypothetical protein [Frankia canadensis]|uniref:SnoaL-like domain-containing protein n=1 Tax=Frankia canadensis TaxID=1836972 RepID=A0A2I2KLC8_9ACTN|nr:nuclear transport factor 2 family protein [Frankia canadensis]SNQ46465.1 conserved hypothetical protein [Frankia canadensis]SOU53755.1 conserved hypothetical protein [Frankia canadensis]